MSICRRLRDFCFRSLLPVLALAGLAPSVPAQASAVVSAAAPAALQTENLSAPLGLDDPSPSFSWQLRDGRRGAHQSAYRIEVATRRELLLNGKADAWDSGRVESSQSLGVVYAGKALLAATRYFWRVAAWDGEGKPYPPSEIAWWETGLMDAHAWSGPSAPVRERPNAFWIGYETWEEAAVRKAQARWISPAPQDLPAGKKPELRVAYRFPFSLDKPVRSAFLFVTGQDTASAWVNGTQVAKGEPLPPYKQFPWKKYVQIDATGALRSGANLLEVETTHFIADPNAAGEPPPMSATLAVQFEDGSVVSFASGNSGDPPAAWTVSTHPGEGWTSAASPDESWKAATLSSQSVDGEPLGNPWPAESVKALRDEFPVRKPVASARLYATALGAYRVFVNGKRAGDNVLAPGWTDYRLRLKYQTYDVTADLTQGKNVVAALLAPGWYSTPMLWSQMPNVYGSAPPSLKAYLRIEYADGSVDWVATDGSWKADASPILKSEIYDGETQDARLIQPGWNTAAFDSARWKAAEIRQYSNGEFVDGENFQPIRIERTLKPVAVAEPKPGVWIYDMGQNFSGVERLRLQGPAGTEVRVRTGEVLNPDGTLYTENLRTAKSTDRFLLAGKGIETFEPLFTYHGFRYLELTGVAGRPLADAVEGVVFHTDAPFTAELKTGSPLIDRLWKNILWGQRSNFVGVPTDCPQRDERLGWMADAQVFWRTASYNMDLAAFSRKFAADMRGTQVGSGQDTAVAGALFGIYAPGVATTSSASGAGWSDAGVIIPWTSWMQTGDTRILTENWAAMTRYLAAIEKTNPDFLWKNNAGIGFGDWLSPEGPTKFPLVATASWAYDATLMEQMARALGKPDEEAHYAQLFKEIQAAFEKEFLQADGYIAGASESASTFSVNNPELKAKGDTQTGYVLALHMHLAPERLRAAVAQKLVDKIHANGDRLATGFLGTPYLLSVLTETGHRDLAYKLLLNTSYPSWGYLVGHGATTMWERWNGDQMRDDPSMNSYNHYAYGAVADWIYRYAAGIDALASDPGFHTVYLHPAFDAQLGSIDFRYQSPYGEIHSAWSVRDGTATWELTLPANTSGWLPLTAQEAANYRLDGAAIGQSAEASPQTRDGRVGFELSAGTYRFEVSGVR